MELPPSIAARYRLERRLGEGGMGVVWLATQRELARPVALKLLATSTAAEFQARFQLEARLAARLNHRGIVRVLDHGLDEAGGAYIAYELVEGEDLAHVIARGLPSAHAVRALLFRIAGALQALHAAGVLHRDLKPANVMVTRDGNPLLIDLGIARDLAGRDALTEPGIVMGTPTYLAPEQISGGIVGPAADVYALGALAYELLTGRPPFVSENVVEILSAHCRVEPAAPTDVRADADPKLARLALACLAKRPAERISLDELRAELERGLGPGALDSGGIEQPPEYRPEGAEPAPVSAIGRTMRAAGPKSLRGTTVPLSMPPAAAARAQRGPAALAAAVACVALGALLAMGIAPRSPGPVASPSAIARPSPLPVASPSPLSDEATGVVLVQVHEELSAKQVDTARLARLACELANDAVARADAEDLVWAFAVVSAARQHAVASGRPLPAALATQLADSGRRTRAALPWPAGERTSLVDQLGAAREDLVRRAASAGLVVGALVPGADETNGLSKTVQQLARYANAQNAGDRPEVWRAEKASQAAVRAAVEQWLTAHPEWDRDPIFDVYRSDWQRQAGRHTEMRTTMLRGLLRLHEMDEQPGPAVTQKHRYSPRLRAGFTLVHELLHVLPEELWEKLGIKMDDALGTRLAVGMGNSFSPRSRRRLLQLALAGRRGVGSVFRESEWHAPASMLHCAPLDVALVLYNLELDRMARELYDAADMETLRDSRLRGVPKSAVYRHAAISRHLGLPSVR